MFDIGNLKRLDLKLLICILLLMVSSFLVITATTLPNAIFVDQIYLSKLTKNQLCAFSLGWLCFFFFVCLDYRRLRDWIWIIYGIMILLLLGLHFTSPIHGVHRWYRLPFLPFDIQPSEYAKLVVVLTLSGFLELKGDRARDMRTFFQAALIVFLPFCLILKQPDLGTAILLCPITLAVFYFGGIRQGVLQMISTCAIVILTFVLSIFLGVLSHEDMKPYFTSVVKEYQYERLNPDSYHQKAGQTAIALGCMSGSGWCKSAYSSQQWLPYGYTDSVFPAFTEEFGLLGACFLLLVFFIMIYSGFQISANARDPFGKLLAAGISAYLAIHVVVNVGMMCGFLPITGVPLILISYGGSSVLSTMMALGILQNISAKRFWST